MVSRGVFAIGLVLWALSPTHALESPIFSGVTFPDLVGKSLTGSDITVGMRDGLAKVVVMTFTKDAAKSAQAWLDACRADETAQSAPQAKTADSVPSTPAPPVVCYDVRMAHDIPRIMRGFIEGRMKKGLRPEHLSRVILVYKDKDVWRDRMATMPDNEDEPFIVMVDRQGRVQSLLHGPFNPAALKAEQAKLVAN